MKLTHFKDVDFLPAIKTLFQELNVPVNDVADEPTTMKEAVGEDNYKENEAFRLVDDVYFVGMVDDAAFEKSKSTDPEKIQRDYDGILIFGVTLKQRPNNLLPTRSQLAELARSFNRAYKYTPVMVVFKYKNDSTDFIAFANTERLKYKQEGREGEKAGKVSLLRDIDIQNPHAGHERIIANLRIERAGRNAVDSFAKLYKHWQEVFNVSILNKKFYKDLSDWYFWAINHVKFPSEPTIEDAHLKNAKLDDLIKEHNATNVIRLLTRLLFTWFIKEKKLVPDELFDLDALQKDILKEISPYHEHGLFKEANKESVYYKAILQNLFFASLNCPIEGDDTDNRSRGFRELTTKTGNEARGKHQGVDYLMRYEEYFKDSKAFLNLMNKTVPFLNGGLFECLDDKENKILLDGFSDNLKGYKEQLIVPDYLFFGATEHVDLSPEYGVKNKGTKQAAVKGLINILHSYKFTVTENTPVEEDVALDPELLGKVFENLLASYNPETKTTARKQTGSFYTPREIVNYMVDESLIAYLKNVLGASSFGTTLLEKEPFLNPNDEIEIKQGNLPHWYQKEVFYHITFRLADSIPKEKVEELKADREKWKEKHKNKKEYTKEDWKEYNRLFNERIEEWMNAGYGSCLLKKKENAAIVANALKHFDRQRYVLDEWVVMPNHVHVLVKPVGENKLSDILHSWKSFTANEINKREGRSGQLWMHESYDHIVRNEKALNAIRNYIRQNPIKAGIVSEASSFGNVPEAESFKNKETQSKDALDTMLHQLISFDPENPFAEDEKLTKQIVKAIDECKILDPACGSGAFPMGILQKMVHMLQKLDPENTIWKEVQKNKAKQAADTAYEIEDTEERRKRLREIDEAFDRSINDPDYARKLYLIENCIYGVDIQPIATQISKLRFFISLVVDQRKNEDKPNFGIRALPNLETKFVAANTLIGIEKPKAQTSLFDTPKVKELEAQLKKVRSRLFSARTKETKLKYRRQDEALRNAIATELKSSGWPNDTAEKLAAWDPYDQNASSAFFDPEWMFDVSGGFDVVIGNPPYGARFSDTEKVYLQQNYFYQDYQLESYLLFLEKGLNTLNRNGHISYIIPNTWITNLKFKNIRKLVFTKNSIVNISHYHSAVFEAVVDTEVVILKKGFKESNLFTVNRVLTKLDVIRSVLDQDRWRNNYEVPINIFLTPEEQAVVSKIEKDSKNLEEFCNIVVGMKPYQKGKGVPKQNETTVRDRIFDSTHKVDNTYKPLLRGSDINKFQLFWKGDRWIKYGPWLAEPRVSANFEAKEKIVLRQTGDSLIANIDNRQFVCMNNLHVITPVKSTNLKFILGLLNSSLLNFYYQRLNPEVGEALAEVKRENVARLKIRMNSQFEKAISIIVGLLIFNNDLDITLSSVLDSLVFNLYFPNHMKEREIDVLEFVERDMQKVLQGREFDNLDDVEKEKIIEQLHATWSDPGNEVVKRMAQFKEKSPNILKPILES